MFPDGVRNDGLAARAGSAWLVAKARDKAAVIAANVRNAGMIESFVFIAPRTSDGTSLSIHVLSRQILDSESAPRDRSPPPCRVAATHPIVWTRRAGRRDTGLRSVPPYTGNSRTVT